jgi:hypothetical protein
MIIFFIHDFFISIFPILINGIFSQSQHVITPTALKKTIGDKNVKK